jgi:hypothetical protein
MIFLHFRQKIGEKISVLDSMQKFEHNIGFCVKTPFFRRKLAKIAKIVIIDP